MARNIKILDGRFKVTGASAKNSNNYQANPILIPTLVPGGSVGQVLAKASNLSYDVEWVTPSSGGAFTFDNGITELAGVVKFGGDLTQEITVLEGDPILNRSLFFGGNNFLNTVGINCTEDVDVVANNISLRTSLGTSSMGNSNDNTLVGVVPVTSSPSGVVVRTSKVQSTSANVGQVFTLKNANNGEGEWENIKYVQTFLIGDFTAQSLTITAATHGKGVNPAVNVYSGTTTRTAVYPGATGLVSITVNVNGDVTLTSSVGNEFNGQIIIT